MSRTRIAAGMAIVLGALTMLIAFTLPSDIGLAAGRKPKPPVITTVRKLAPGVKLTKIVDRRIPRRTFILAIDPSKGATLRFVLSNDLIPDLERTSSMARRSGALAAVNGDFGSPSTGRPMHPMAIDSELIQTSLDLSGSFAISADGSMRIDQPEPAVSVTEIDTGEVFPIDSWNGFRPHVGDLNGYTAVGGTSFGPPTNACWARLSPVTEPDPEPAGVLRDYDVSETSCTPDRPPQEMTSSWRPCPAPMKLRSSVRCRQARPSELVGRSVGPRSSTPWEGARSSFKPARSSSGPVRRRSATSIRGRRWESPPTEGSCSW